MQPTAAEPTTDALGAELVHLAARLNRAVTRLANGTAAEVPTASLRLLAQVEESGPVTIGALATADRCSQPTMSAGVATLCHRGWATKRRNPADARSSVVSLTEAGRAVLEAARADRAEVIASRLRAAPGLDEQDLRTAVSVLRGLLEEVQPAP